MALLHCRIAGAMKLLLSIVTLCLVTAAIAQSKTPQEESSAAKVGIYSLE